MLEDHHQLRENENEREPCHGPRIIHVIKWLVSFNAEGTCSIKPSLGPHSYPDGYWTCKPLFLCGICAHRAHPGPNLSI